MKVDWSEVAEADIGDLYDYIARDVPYYAEQFIDKLIDAVAMLAEHPLMGRCVPEADGREDIRELIFHNYRIIYLLEPERLYILTVIHGSQDLAGREAKPWEVV